MYVLLRDLHLTVTSINLPTGRIWCEIAMPTGSAACQELLGMCLDRQCHAYTLCGEAQRLHGGAYIAEIVRRVPSMRAQIVLAMNGGLWDDADMPVPSSHARLLLARGLA